MARIKNGILGGFSGKVGAVVGYHIGENFYIRAKPSRRKKFTAAELANQAKFKLVNDYLRPLKDLLRAGFKNYYTPTGGIRAAISYTLKTCLEKDGEGFRIIPERLKISGGQLLPALSPKVDLEQKGMLVLSWENQPQAKSTDQLLLLLFNHEQEKAFTLIFDGPKRNEKQLVFEFPEHFSGHAFDLYIGFIAADRSAQSNSQYLGRFDL